MVGEKGDQLEGGGDERLMVLKNMTEIHYMRMSQWTPLWTVLRTSKLQWKSFLQPYLRILCTFLCPVHVSEHFLEYHQRGLTFIHWAARAGVLSNIMTIFHKIKQKFHCTQMEYSSGIICTEWSTCWCSCMGLITTLPGYGGVKRWQSGHLKPGEWSTVFIKTPPAGNGCPVF